MKRPFITEVNISPNPVKTKSNMKITVSVIDIMFSTPVMYAGEAYAGEDEDAKEIVYKTPVVYAGEIYTKESEIGEL